MKRIPDLIIVAVVAVLFFEGFVPRLSRLLARPHGGLIGGMAFVALLILLPTVGIWWSHRPPDPRTLPGHCRKCGYDLTGNESGRCPECGMQVRLSGGMREGGTT